MMPLYENKGETNMLPCKTRLSTHVIYYLNYRWIHLYQYRDLLLGLNIVYWPQIVKFGATARDDVVMIFSKRRHSDFSINTPFGCYHVTDICSADL